MSKQFNPYIFGEPVRDHQAFYGRTKLVAIVFETLSVATESLLVFFGQRRIGKTSLAQNLKYWPELEHFVFVYNDASEIATKNTIEALYHLSYQIADTFGLRPLDKSALQQDIKLFQNSFLPQINQKLNGKRLVLIFDEFDAVSQREAMIGEEHASQGENILSVMDDLIQNAPPELAFIIFLARGEKRLDAELRRILRTSRWAKVSLLEAEEARQLILEPAMGILNYHPKAVDEVMDLTSGHPYYIQLVCHNIFNELQMAEGEKEVRVSDVRVAAQKALDSGQGGFGWLWQGLSPAEKLVLALLAKAAESRPDRVVTEDQLSKVFEDNRIYRAGVELTSTIDHIIELDLIERRGPQSYRFLVELIRQWTCQNHPPAQERDEQLAHLSQRAVDEFARGQRANTLSEGIRHYQAAVAANPNYLEARLALGEALLKNKQHYDAVEAYRAASWLDQVRSEEDLKKAEAAWEQAGRSKSRRVWLVASLVALAVVAFLGLSIFKPGGGQATSSPPISIKVGPDQGATPILGSVSEVPTPTFTPTVAAQPTRTEAALTSAGTNIPSPMMPTSTPTILPTEETDSTSTVTLAEEPSPTFSPTPSLTPIPTDTPAPTNTSTPTIVPVVRPSAVIDTYKAPILIAPVSEIRIPANEDAILEWNSIGALADNEHYAVRLIFNMNNKRNYSGDQLREITWKIPREFQERVDGPQRRFTWYVYVERVLADGQIVQISPESEHRVFYWGPD